MKMGLHAAQQQKLVINKQMTTSLNILQMPIQQLKEHIEKEIESNVVIDIKENNQNNKFNNMAEEDVSPFLFIREEQSFEEYLILQVSEQVQEKKVQELCFYIIRGLDHRGFLIDSTDDIAQAIGTSEEKVIKALAIVQSLEPTGVGAENIKQCLRLQVDKKNPKDKSIIQLLIDDYLEQIATHRYQKIAEELNITLSKVHKYIDFIKGLEPIPSQGFYTGEIIPYVTPDARIEENDGTYEIIIDERHLPRIFINPTYAKLLQQDIDSETKAYLQSHMEKAISLMKDIRNRGNTLQRVIKAIISFQKEYFSEASSYAKPMTLNDIALMVELHESTVSRTVQEKHIDIEGKIISLKDLFVQGMPQGTSEEMSIEEIKDRILVMINQEDKKKPLSDQYIYIKIKDQGIQISRRTVSKYRQEMGIGSSTQRKHR